PAVRRARNAEGVGVGLVATRLGLVGLLDQEPLLRPVESAPRLAAERFARLGVGPGLRGAAHTFNRGARPMSAAGLRRIPTRRLKTPHWPSRAASGGRHPTPLSPSSCTR